MFTAAAVYGALNDPNVSKRVMFHLFGLFGAFMTLNMFWELLFYSRETLTVQGDRLVYRGVVRVVEIDLQDVTEARWLSGGAGVLILRTRPMLRLKRRLLGIGRSVLRPSVSKINLVFEKYEVPERESLVRYFHAALPPDVQKGWNMFAYKVTTGEPKPEPRKPGPGVVLFLRNRWDRWFLPLTLGVFLIGVLDSGMQREVRFLLPTLAPLFSWIVMRATTPAEGKIVPRLSRNFDPEVIPFLVFASLWLIAGGVAILLINHWQPNQAGLNAPTIVASVIWVTVFMVEVELADRRRRRRTRERADLAAKARGEACPDPWETV